MKVDRSLFHLFTGAIAASAVACVVKEYQPPPPPPPAPPPAAQNAAQPQPANHPPIGHLQPIQPGHEGQATNNPPPHIQPIVPHNGPTPIPTASCLDQGSVAAPTCSASLTSSCSGNAFPMQRCQAYLQYFDPKVGANAVNCMNGLGANSCDAQHAYDCGKAALAQSCPDNTTTAQLCQIAAGPCKVAANDCVTMLSGLNSNGQDAVAQCVAGGCSAGLYSCIEGLGATSSKH